MSKDPFAQVPEFLAAFDNILANGFFEGIHLEVGDGMTEGYIFSCSIKASGCVPDDTKYMQDGSGALVDPHAIIASCRALAETKKIKMVTTDVETTDWLRYGRNDKVVGSKGKRTKMFISITFKP